MIIAIIIMFKFKHYLNRPVALEIFQTILLMLSKLSKRVKILLFIDIFIDRHRKNEQKL